VSARFVIELLNQHHNRTDFTCGVEVLERYYCTQVSQDIRRRATTCYVASEVATNQRAGYYTLAAGSV